jgi:hypothetical protein
MSNVVIGGIFGFTGGFVTALIFYKNELQMGIAVRNYARNIVGTLEERASAIEKFAITKAHEIADKL